MRFELTTSSLPRKCSTPELQRRLKTAKKKPTSGPLRAADETRTRDIQLGRLTLYQLSYHRITQEKGGGGGIRTYSAVKHQIYSLARLSNSGAPPLLYLFKEPVEGLEPPTS